METAAHALLLLCWTVLAVLAASVPGCGAGGLRVALLHPARRPSQQGAPRRRRAARSVTFVDMIDNLRGKSGQGYYVEMAVGTPPQKVRFNGGGGGVPDTLTGFKGNPDF